MLGAGFVLPISAVLPGGFLGKVTSISPDGRNVTLAPAGLSEAFTAYNLAVTMPQSPAEPLTPALEAGAGSARRGLALGRCGGGAEASDELDLHPTLSFGGTHLSVTLQTKRVFGVSVPTGAEFSLDAKAMAAISPEISTSGAVSCDLVNPVILNLPTAPVPMAIVFDPDVGLSIGGKGGIDGVTATMNLGFGADGEFGASNAFSTSFAASASMTGNPDVGCCGDNRSHHRWAVHHWARRRHTRRWCDRRRIRSTRPS